MLKYDNTVSSTVDGKPIYGAQVAVLDEGGALALIFSDEMGTTPLSQPILTDQLGYFSFYIGDGRYDISVTTGVTEISRTNITMVDTLGLKSRALLVPVNEESGTLPSAEDRKGTILGFSETTGAPVARPLEDLQGPTGPANATYATIAAIAASDITNGSAILAPTEGSGLTGATYTWKTGNYTGRNDVIASSTIPITQGAWVLPDAGAVTFKGIDSTVTQLLDARAKRAMYLSDHLPSGFVTTGGVDYTAAIQKAMNKSVEYGVTLELINGVFDVAGVGPIAPSGLKMRGAGREKTIIRNLNGSVLRMNGTGYDFSDFLMATIAGGHVIQQTGSVNRSALRRVGLLQYADNFGLWDNAGHPYIKNELDDFYFQHTETATVHGINLVSVGGDINDNSWKRGWAQYSGNYMFNVEATGATAHYANEWDSNTFEVCSGGGIRQISGKNFTITKNRCWDVSISALPGSPTIRRHFYMIDRNGMGVTTSGDIIRNSRFDSDLAAGICDAQLASGGASADIEIRGNASVAGAQPFLIDARDNFVWSIAPNTVCQIINNGSGTSFDPLSGTQSLPNGLQVDGASVVGRRVTGFSAMIGTANKAVISTFDAPAAGATYSQTQMQAVANATQETSQRLKALDDALRAHGLVGS